MQDIDKMDANLKNGEERIERYVEGNMKADKLADKAMERQDLPKSIFNKYQNEYIKQSTRKKVTKKSIDKPEIINTRVRKTIKKIVREEYNNNLLRKEKYDKLKKYSEKTSKFLTQILDQKCTLMKVEEK